MMPQPPTPGTYWRDANTGTLVRVKAAVGGVVDYESKFRAGWCRLEEWGGYFVPAESKQERKSA